MRPDLSALTASMSCAVLDVEMFAGSLDEAACAVVERAKKGSGGYVCQCNVHVLTLAQRVPRFRSALEHAAAVLPDGAPIARPSDDTGSIGPGVLEVPISRRAWWWRRSSVSTTATRSGWTRDGGRNRPRHPARHVRDVDLLRPGLTLMPGPSAGDESCDPLGAGEIAAPNPSEQRAPSVAARSPSSKTPPSSCQRRRPTDE
jgi:hypothetical protein